MDMDKLGPIALFIVYMAISAWAKQKKAKQRAIPKEQPGSPGANTPSSPVRGMGGIFEQLKKELFEIEEEPIIFQNEAPELELETEAEIVAPEPVTKFAEGSDERLTGHLQTKLVELTVSTDVGQSLDTILEPYSKLEQGILLHEILGKPRGMQTKDDWVHKS